MERSMDSYYKTELLWTFSLRLYKLDMRLVAHIKYHDCCVPHITLTLSKQITILTIICNVQSSEMLCLLTESVGECFFS